MTRRGTLPEPLAAPELTVAQWFDLPEDEPGELVGGRLVEEEVPSYVHEVLVILFGSLFRAWIVPRGGFVGGSGAKLAVGEDRGRKPDLTVYFPGRSRPPARGLVTVPPDLALEIVSPTPADGRRDRVEKVRDYAEFGVRYYWIVDRSCAAWKSSSSRATALTVMRSARPRAS